MTKNILLFVISFVTFSACTNSKNKNMETQELIVKQDPHSYARSNESKVTHLSMNLAVDFEKKILKGKATLTIQSEAGANKIHLDTKDLNIEKITLNDSDAVSYTHLLHLESLRMGPE